MKKIKILLPVLVLALVFAACGPADESEPQAGELGTPTPETEFSPGEAQDPDGEPELEEPSAIQVPPELGQTDPGLRGANVLPETGRDTATQLTVLLDYQVKDQNGENLGQVADYVLNMCEAHIIYIIVQANQSLDVEGDFIIIPYEAVTLEGGVIDVDSQNIFVNFTMSQFTGTAAYQDHPDLSTTGWEDETRYFWSELMNLSNLTTECRVPAQEGEGRQVIVRIAYASEVIGAELVNGRNEHVGEIEEVIVVPESGLMRFSAISTGQGMIAAPPGALNIQANGDSQTDDLTLVLLVEDGVLVNAPRVENLPELEPSWEARFFDYWSQHLPMTREDLP
jgi:sporulation protein YlmC with PRC-barrel domain